MTNIPMHQLLDRTDLGVQMKYLHKDELVDDPSTMEAHRDDHYIFFMLEKGQASMMIDFTEVQLKGKTVYYLLPGQVHYRIDTEMASGWFVAVDTALIPKECRNVFETQLFLQQPQHLSHTQFTECQTVLNLLHLKYNDSGSTPFYRSILHSLLQSFISIVATYYAENKESGIQTSRQAQLSAQFKEILNTDIRFRKSPASFAAQMNISEAYLSEVLKKKTGFPASYWIQQEIILEAKRLLYYTELGVKEIAHDLGYTDHSYFSRFFRKSVGLSALAFRHKYRE